MRLEYVVPMDAKMPATVAGASASFSKRNTYHRQRMRSFHAFLRETGVLFPAWC